MINDHIISGGRLVRAGFGLLFRLGVPEEVLWIQKRVLINMFFLTVFRQINRRTGAVLVY
jgi:hypothetical protein